MIKSEIIRRQPLGINCLFHLQSAMKCKIWWMLLILHLSPLPAQTVYFPANHWVYDYLDRLETKGILPVVLSGTKPMTRTDIAGYLFAVTNYYQRGGKLSETETEQLEYLQYEFREEMELLSSKMIAKPTDFNKIVHCSWIDPILPDLIYANGRNLLQVVEGPFNIYWDPIFMRRRLYAVADTLSGREHVFEDSNGFVLWGFIGQRVGFYTNIRDTKEWGTRSYPEGVNYSTERWGFVQGSGSHAYHDETVASVVYQHKFLTLQYGKDGNRWGPGAHGQLGLSDRATSYDMAKMQIASSRIKFTSLLAWLQHYENLFFYGNHQEKALAAHRLEFSPFRRIDIGIYETIIYSGRRIEPAYLNPVNFFRSADHYLGERDNAAMGLDWEFKLYPKSKFYGELFIDDLTTGKLGTSFYGNKYAWLVGLFCIDPLGIGDMDIRAEYARLRPFTYSHDRSTSYQHYATGLGYWGGPNSDDLLFQVRYQYSQRLNLWASWERYRHGANFPDKNVGGDIWRPHSSARDLKYINFLDGKRELNDSYAISFSYELIRNGFIQASYRNHLNKTDNNNFPGRRSEFAFMLYLNY